MNVETKTSASGPVAEVQVAGKRYLVALPHAAIDYIQRTILAEHKPYEQEMLEDMRQRLAPGTLVLDVGANVGNHTIFLAVVAGCRVAAFEPNPALCAALRESLELNAIADRVQLHEVGVGREPTRATFEKDVPENLGAQKLRLGDGEFRVVPLDAMSFEQPVAAIKIDVEGMEGDVLIGAKALIERDRPLLYVECAGDAEFRVVSRWLDERGYTFWDTFNITPTHLFLPLETVSLDRRLARLQLRAVHDDYRSAQIATSVRRKLTQAYENERLSRQRIAELERQTTKLDEAQEQALSAIAVLKAELGAKREALGKATADTHALHGKLRALEGERKQAHSAVAALKAELSAKGEALGKATADTHALQGQLRALEGERDKAIATATDLQARHDALSEEGHALLRQSEAIASQRDALMQECHALRSESEALTSQVGFTQGKLEQSQMRVETLEAELANQRRARSTAESDAARDSATAARRSAALEREIAALQRDVAESQRALRVKASRLASTERRLDRVSSSSSYRLGMALVGATRSVGGLLRLPSQLWMIARSSKMRREARLVAKSQPLDTGLANDGAPSPIAVPAGLPPRAKLTERKSARNVERVSQLRIACVLDEFSTHSFGPECELLHLRADQWRAQIESFDPDFVFLESAWRGADDTWLKKVSDPSPELFGLIDWALARGVATAFWCKEDPVHFARFLPVAQLVDHVFTTDIDCIPRYKDALKHDRIHLLPFAAQPRMHNPIETIERKDIFSFAGSWYPHYPERQVDFRALVRVGRRLKSVEIWDRNASRPPPHDFVFPEEFRDEIRGNLPYEQIDRAYKGCRYGITVNTIKQSQTMFARRALELMACNTVVVSNFSKGLRTLFGDIVIASDSAVEIERRLAPLCTDDAQYRRHRLRGLRKVLAEHTCEHRMAYVASKVLGQRFDAAAPRIALLGAPRDAHEAATLMAALDRQSWPASALVLVGSTNAAGHAGVEELPDRLAALARMRDFDYVAPISAADYHGPDYLTDLALATCFATGDGVTKTAFYTMDDAGGVSLQGNGRQYRSVRAAALRRSLLRPALLTPWAEDAAVRLEDASIESEALLAVDEFSYCAEGARLQELAAAAVDVGAMLRSGASLQAQLLPCAESVKVPATQLDTDAPIMLGAKDWYRLLPAQIDTRLRLRMTEQHSVELESTLPASDNQYIYLTRRFTPAELKAGRETFFQMEADTRLDLRTVFVFNDANKRKLSHAMHTVGARHALNVPVGTFSVRLALRVQGPGKATLGRLSLAEPRGLPPQVLPTARHLVVANQYPSYDDLYRYGFVHTRVRAYAREGVTAEVLRVSPDPRVKYREFEDVDVTEADASHLEQCLAGGHYASVLVHILDQRIWNVVRQHLDRVRVVVWAHGAEIQPWWRRAMNHPTDALRDQARRTSDARMAMWREILGRQHPNLHVVFISGKQAAEALSDLQLTAAAADAISLIPNFVDSELFRYAEKDSAQRHRLLSIRPFASPVYANDLTVQAVLRLAREPFFEQLQIRIIGDGALFEETVAPLRGLANVELTRAFLTQREIAALHREYGVFLVPSRMDSQGVSRDEAMASGLVPVTTRIAAIPEFVDTDCAFLAEPEDAAGLAAAVRRLHEDPELFERMSAAAARRVRAQSGHARTVARELALFAHGAATATPAPPPALVAAEAAATRIALYGDLNLNVMDGSAIWAASLAEVLGGIPDIRVSLVLKARIQRTQVIARLLDMAPAVQIVEPEIADRGALTPADAADWLVTLDARNPYRAFVLRGLDVCSEAARRAPLQGRIWAYLTDIPQHADDLDAPTRERIESIVAHSEFVLCQTPSMRDYFVAQFPAAAARARLLPPMIPPPGEHETEPASPTPFRYCYAGKFAPRWGIRELFAAHSALREDTADAELHVFGDKIHNPPDDPEFNPGVKARLEAGEGLLWHGAIGRDELLRRLPAMHVCWAYRDPVFERETLELSTKALEYASLGVPMILARSPVIEAVFGADYPLFAASGAEATALLKRLAHEPALRAAAAARLEQVAAHYTFAAARERLQADGMVPPPHLAPRAVLSPVAAAGALSTEAA